MPAALKVYFVLQHKASEALYNNKELLVAFIDGGSEYRVCPIRCRTPFKRRLVLLEIQRLYLERTSKPPWHHCCGEEHALCGKVQSGVLRCERSILHRGGKLLMGLDIYFLTRMQAEGQVQNTGG